MEMARVEADSRATNLEEEEGEEETVRDQLQ
jgi:hypothetical protein